MKERTETALRQFSLFFGDALDINNVKQESEAYALGVDQSFVSKAKDPDSTTNLPAGLITSSKVARPIMEHLAEMMGLGLVPIRGKADGNVHRQVGRMVKLMGEMIEFEHDPKKINKALDEVINIAEILKEESK